MVEVENPSNGGKPHDVYTVDSRKSLDDSKLFFAVKNWLSGPGSSAVRLEKKV